MSGFISTVTAADLTRFSKRSDLSTLVSITPTTTLQEALAVLAEHGILALPLFNPESNTYQGMISMYEIMSYIAWASWDGEHPEKLTPDNFSTMIDANVHLETKASEILGSSGIRENDARNGLWLIKGVDGIKHLFELLSKGVYRVLVDVNGYQKLVSQSDFVKFLHANMDKFGAIVKETVSAAKLGSSKVLSVHETDNALWAFRQLRLKEVQGFAVVDASGALIGNFSASDMRGLKASDLGLLSLSVGDFLRRRSGTKTIRAPITVPSSATISTVLDTFVTSNVHRVFVVDAGHTKASGVITLTDVILHFFTANLAEFYPPAEESS